jgi:hypothetical protein
MPRPPGFNNFLLNVIVDNGWNDVGSCDCLMLHSERDHADPIVRVPAHATMPDLLVALGSFPSKGQARKNWRGPLEIPRGYSTFRVGRRFLFVYNPIPWPTADELARRWRERA